MKPVLGKQITFGHALNARLVLDLPFNEGSGIIVRDASGNSNHGTIVNATWAGGKYGSCLSFNGSNAYVNLGAGATVSPTAAITVAAWINPLGFAELITGLEQYVSKGFDGSQVQYILGVNNTSGNNLGFGFYNGSWRFAGVAHSSITGTIFHHFVGTYDGLTIRFYINGIQVASTDYTGSMPASAQALTLGGNNWGGTWFYASCLIDNVQIFNRALLSCEVQQLYMNTWQRYAVRK